MFVTEKAEGEVKELDAASKLLLKAAALLEKPGEWEGNKGRNCALSAIWEMGDIAQIKEAETRFVAQFGSKQGVYNWNDAKGRTAAEVIAKLRAVAFASKEQP